MGAGGFHGRVRDGIGCGLPAEATRLSNPPPGSVTMTLPGTYAGRVSYAVLRLVGPWGVVWWFWCVCVLCVCGIGG